jgi:predicted lysophospholipase L1 biosynthesis ABC-type transport system permease subunit
MLLLSGLGLLGTLFTTGRNKMAPAKGKSLMLIAVLALLVAGTGLTVGCGNYSKPSTANNATVNVIGTSGGVSHSVPLNVSVH